MKIFGNYITTEQDRAIYDRIENGLKDLDNVNNK